MAQTMRQEQAIEKYGPYGRETALSFEFSLEKKERIKTVTVGHGRVVHGIGFEIIDLNSGDVRNVYFGHPGYQSAQIEMKNGEYVTHISGLHGRCTSGGHGIAQIRIHTNLNPTQGYGPFGQASQCVDNQSFATPSDARVVGFFGAASDFLHSVGVSVVKETP